MKDHEAAKNALAELMEALQTAQEVAEQTERELRAAGFERCANELDRYLTGSLVQFADDENQYQSGSIGSLLRGICTDDQ